MPTWNSGDPRPALPPFSGTGSACPKCGLQSPSLRYYERCAEAPYGSKAYSAPPEAFPCIQRTCGSCGFQTLEAPLSASDALTLPPPVMPRLEDQ